MYQLFFLSFFSVQLHSYTVKYMFLNFCTQWNSMGRRTDVGRQRLNRELESLFIFILLVFRTKQDA